MRAAARAGTAPPTTPDRSLSCRLPPAVKADRQVVPQPHLGHGPVLDAPRIEHCEQALSAASFEYLAEQPSAVLFMCLGVGRKDRLADIVAGAEAELAAPAAFDVDACD